VVVTSLREPASQASATATASTAPSAALCHKSL
jgi:hypothetical protein